MPMNESVDATVTDRSAGVEARWRTPPHTLRSSPSRASPAGGGMGTRRTAASATTLRAAEATTAAPGDTVAASTPASDGPATPATLYDVDSAP